MGTTDAFVEHVVAGLVGCIWILPLGAAVYGVDFDPLAVPGAVLIFVGTAYCYVAGVAIDRVADRTLEPVSTRILRRHFASRDDYEATFNSAMETDPFLEQIKYSRHRERLMRSSVVNSLAVAVTYTGLLLVSGPYDLGPRQKVTTLVLGLAAAAMFLFAWWQVRLGHFRRLRSQVGDVTT